MLLSPLLDRRWRIFFSLLLTTFSVLSGASSVKMCWIELGVEDTGHIFGIKLKRKLCFQKENRKLSIHIYPAVKKLSITCISQSVSYSAAFPYQTLIDTNYIFQHHPSQKWKLSGITKLTDCAATWPGPAGHFLLTLASLGKEWPSFLWTRHCVRSPGSGRPFHFMVHRPCAWLCRAFRCRGGNVSWNWCPCQRCAALPSFPEHVTSLIGELPFRCDERAPPLSPAYWPWQKMTSCICYRGDALLASFALAEWKSNGSASRQSW